MAVREANSLVFLRGLTVYDAADANVDANEIGAVPNATGKINRSLTRIPL